MSEKTLIEKLGERYGVDPSKLLTTLKATAFKQRNGSGPTNEQMMSLLVVADQYGLNPFTKEMYAYPDKGGIIPVVGVDGWSRVINAHDQFDGMKFIAAEEMVDLEHAKSAPMSMTCIVYRKDRTHPVAVTEYLDEVYRPPFKTQAGQLIPGPWQTHPKRMLRHKTMIQACRLAFGLVGIYDQDEAERIVEANATREETDTGKYGGVTVATVNGKPVGELPGRGQESSATSAAAPEATATPTQQEQPAQPTEASTVAQAKADLSDKEREFALAVVARVQQTCAWNAGRELARDRLQGAGLDYVLAAIDTAEQAATQSAASRKNAA